MNEQFPPFNTPDLTPEERIRERERLQKIDSELSKRAFDTLEASYLATHDPEYLAEEHRRVREQLEQYIIRVVIDFSITLDAEFERARVVTYEEYFDAEQELPMYRSRKRQARMPREIAAWPLIGNFTTLDLVYITREGEVVAAQKGGSYDLQRINLDDLSFHELEEIHDCLKDCHKILTLFYDTEKNNFE